MTHEIGNSGTLVDFDTSFAAALESEIMHLGPRLVTFINAQAAQQHCIDSLQAKVESLHGEMRNASAHALLAEQNHSALNMLSHKEREQATSAINQQKRESRLATEKLAMLEATVKQNEKMRVVLQPKG